MFKKITGQDLLWNARIKIREIVPIFILLFPICDITTGFMIFRMGISESFVGSPSQLIRLIFIATGFCVITHRQQKICLGILLWVIFIESFSLFYIPYIKLFVSGLNYSLKILYIVIAYFWINNYCNLDYNYFTKFKYCVLISACIYSFGIIIPTLLGISRATYHEGTFGQKGLIASGNAAGIYLGVIFCILTSQKIKISQTFIFLSILSALILLATKTALGFIIIGLLLGIITLKKSIKYPIMIGTISLLLIFSPIIMEQLSIVADVIIFRFEHSDNIWSFLMSSRDDYIIDAFKEFYKSPIWIFKLIFGGGAFISFRSKYFSGMEFDTLENEFCDVLFMYGIIGIFFYLGIMIHFLKRIFNKSNILGFIFLLFCLHSIVAGHVLFDGIPTLAGILIIEIAKHKASINSQIHTVDLLT